MPRSQDGPRAGPNAKSGFASLGRPKPTSTGSPSHAEGPCLLPAPARPTQSSEPILFPKLRIRLADFPYLHCSIDQRLFTLETCCGYGYDLRRESTLVPRIFKGRPVQHRTPLQTRRSTGPRSLSPIQSVSGKPAPYKEKTTLPGAPASVSGLHSFAALTTKMVAGSAFRFGNIDPIPFRPGGANPRKAGARRRSERNFPRP